MENKKQIYEQHAENSDWINRLEFYKEEISLPIHPNLTKKDLNKIIKVTKRYFGY